MKTPVNKGSFSERFGKHIHEVSVPNDELFKVLNLCVDYLGLKSPKEVSEIENVSVQRIYKKYSEDIIEVKGIKMIQYNN